jgi:LCP family protein required for cell wall assembly
MSENKLRRGASTNTQTNQKKSHREIKFLHKAIAVTVLVALALVSWLYVTQWYIPTQASSKPLSILLVGTDIDQYRDEEYNGEKPERTDAIVVATFNPDTYKLEMTSIPRDTAVDYVCPTGLTDPMYGEVMPYRGPINDLYELSGKSMECLTATVENFLNIPIDYYVKFDLSEAEQIIDIVGGIEVTVHAADGSFCQYTTDSSKQYCFEDGETITMMGEEAMTYARFRKDSENDQGRGIRQQQVVTATLKKLLEAGFDINLMQSIFAMVDTNMEPKLMYDYLIYFDNMSKVTQMVEGEIPVDVSLLPESAWLRIMNSAGYNAVLVNDSTVNGFIEYMNENKEKVSEMFVINHQFYNEQYNGFFVATDEDRYEISNALRANLTLSEEEPKPYQYDLAKSGLPFDEDLNRGNDDVPPPSPVSPEVPEEPAVEEPVEDIDTDGDGYYDYEDICEGYYDSVDSDFDGIPDGCDATPKPVVPTPTPTPTPEPIQPPEPEPEPVDPVPVDPEPVDPPIDPTLPPNQPVPPTTPVE